MLKFDEMNAPEDATGPPEMILMSSWILNLLWMVCTTLKVQRKQFRAQVAEMSGCLVNPEHFNQIARFGKMPQGARRILIIPAE